MDPRAAFRHFAGDGGRLDLDSLSCAVIAVFGFKFKKQDLRDLMEQYASESGLKMEAFLALVEDRRRVFGERDRALRLFSALDVKDQGFLDVKSFHELCLETCRPLGAQSTELFRDMDRSKSGSVTFSDFEAYLAGDASPSSPRADRAVSARTAPGAVSR
ncbi:unnamed protein product [Durusdinium trenchii]|uniref:Uncharacterized protein n=2 Tax=Durusdinium trenchii TaxID=1381693 RepID=A0ABP0LLR3_9DINO